ncbi:LAME_0E09604g1_1 [Lachancea meyersii CBS 8951]|uniref:LAME_0E09604g1_1 n=1 Tax=Lachancea meyersii CBS 8951 TaxID=1266667 RepID=A0A1G4JJI3_9SACH|nr:LAME_0E09604g1_1 [Lachancea meyersii CBS 8951]
MLKTVARPSKLSLNALRLATVRHFHVATPSLGYKKWADLNLKDKQAFINQYIDLYKEKHPCSPSNTMHRTLVGEMEEFDDAPYVFGIVYNEIRSVAQGESLHNVKGRGALGDPDFEKLLFNGQ